MKNFEIISSNPSNEGKTHVTKLQTKSVVETAFGTKETQETYYVSASKQMPIGRKMRIDLATWNVVERQFEVDGKTINCKWLHLKAGVAPVAQLVAETAAKETV